MGRSYGSDNWAFIWDVTNGMRELDDVLINEFALDLTGWSRKEATDISADGLTIVGHGTNPSGDFEGWIATISEPGTGSLLALMALAAGSRAERGLIA